MFWRKPGKSMTVMRLCALFLILLWGTLSSFADESTVLVIYERGGGSVSFLVDDRPMLSFSDDCLLVTSDSVEVSYPLSDVWKYTYEQTAGSSAISDVSYEGTSFSIDGGLIVFSGLNGSNILRVYTLGGLLLEDTTVSTASYTYSLSSLSAGVYIISMNGMAFKILKK